MPLAVAITIWLIWETIGIATLAGLGVLLIMMPAAVVVVGRTMKFQVRLSVLAAKRDRHEWRCRLND